MMRLAAVFVAFVATGATVLFAPVAHGLALGEIQLQSRLNEPLAATIPLIVANTNEFQSLRVTVATPEAFERAGLQYDDYMGSVVLSLAPASGLTPPRIVVSSSDIAREPFVDLMIEAKSSSGRIIRNYTILLDPPTVPAASVVAGVAPATPVVPSNKPVPAPQPTAEYALGAPAAAATPATPVKPAAAEPVDPNTQLPSMSSDDPAYFASGAGWVDGEPAQAAAAPPAAAAPVDAASETYGPIGKQETLWSIAYKLRPEPSITMDQMQLAIFRANPDAFAGNINRLLSGTTLTIPSAASIRAVDAASAKQEVARQRNSYVPPAGARMAPPAGASMADNVTPPDAPEVDDAQRMAPVDTPAPDDEDLFAPVEPDPVPVAGDAPAADDAAEAADTHSSQASAPAPASSMRAPAANPPSNRPMTALERLRAERAGQPVTPAPQAEPAPEANEADDAMSGDDSSVETDAALESGDAVVDVDDTEAGEPLEAPAVADEPAEDATPTAVTPPPPASINAPAEPDGGGLPWGLIGGLLALLLGAAAVLGLRRRKQADASSATMAAPVAAAASDDDADADDGKLGDTAVIDEAEYGLGDTAKPAPRNDVVPDVPVIDTPEGGLDEATDGDAIDAEATAKMAAQAAPETAEPEADPAAPDGDDEDAMAATMQFDANTISLDLSGDDPISEADVHLAYGATDEAASVMEQAVAAAPDHPSYAAKLAEIYFTANNRDKFLAHVGKAQSALQSGSGDSWQKVLILGQQIAPDDALFADAGAADLQSADFDFGSDPEDVTEASADDDLALDLGVEGADDDATPAAAEATEVAADDSDDNSLEFDLGDLDLPQGADEADTPEVEASPDDTGDSVEFDLGDFDLGDDAESAEPNTAAQAEASDDGAVEFDLGEASAPEPAPVAEDSGDVEADGDAIDLGDFELDVGDEASGEDGSDVLGDLSDFDLGGDDVADDADAGVDTDTAALDESSLDALLGGEQLDDGGIEADADDITTKLDLARTYAESGDSDLAESLLNDVVDGGDPEQQDAARQLLASLGKSDSGDT